MGKKGVSEMECEVYCSVVVVDGYTLVSLVDGKWNGVNILPPSNNN